MEVERPGGETSSGPARRPPLHWNGSCCERTTSFADGTIIGASQFESRRAAGRAVPASRLCRSRRFQRRPRPNTSRPRSRRTCCASSPFKTPPVALCPLPLSGSLRPANVFIPWCASACCSLVCEKSLGKLQLAGSELAYAEAFACSQTGGLKANTQSEDRNPPQTCDGGPVVALSGLVATVSCDCRDHFQLMRFAAVSSGRAAS